MKKIMVFAAFILALAFNPLKAQNDDYQDDGYRDNGNGNYESRNYHGYTHERETFNYFYNSLNPYGEWLALDNDVYAWHPYNVGRRWQPYTVGRWVWTSDGWYWDSFEPFGWATYHYGRWYYDDYYGWIWIPDSQWGPAWVEWRYSDDYIGWAPLPPYAIYDIHIGIHFSYDWHFPYSCWNFVPYRYFDGYDVHRYYVAPKEKYRLYSNTRYRNDYAYSNGRVINRGVDRQFVERRSGRNVQQRDIIQTRTRDVGNRTRDNNRVEVFRPGRQDLAKTRDITNMNIKRTDRRSTLALDKVNSRLGKDVRREDINRNGRTDQNPVVRDRGNQNKPGNNRTPEVITRPEGNRNPDVIRRPEGNQTPRTEIPNDRGSRQNSWVNPGSRNGNDQRPRDRVVEKQGNNPYVNPPQNRNENTPRGNQTPQVRENRPPERTSAPQVRENRQRQEKQGGNERSNGSRGNERDRRR
ncbi:MAG TPA: DUF6600 domain-containing protein [Ignavibacteriales bacterium]|nr:DUF6600 domain-containing protein [Ignavibacteriales bacterium]